MVANEDTVVVPDLERRFAKMESQGKAQLQAQHVPEEDIRLVRSVDLRYEGQSYELNTPVPDRGPLTDETVREIIDSFHQLHYQVYAYGSVDERMEFINLRVTAIDLVPEVKLNMAQATGVGEVKKDRRLVYFFGHGFVESAIFDRDKLSSGISVNGPCLIEEVASMTVIPPGTTARVDEYGSMIVEWP